MKSIKITNDEWLKELGELGLLDGRRNDEGLTTKEWAEKWGMCPAKTRNIIGEGIKRGLIKHGRQSRETMNGVVRYIDVYAFTKK